MKHFIYFSSRAATSGKILSEGDLMKAGRMDIAIHTLISAFFLSHEKRKDVKLHLIFYGMPDPPKHIEMQITDKLDISKKDVANLIKKILKNIRKVKSAKFCLAVLLKRKVF